jgi:hypothetical protein
MNSPGNLKFVSLAHSGPVEILGLNIFTKQYSIGAMGLLWDFSFSLQFMNTSLLGRLSAHGQAFWVRKYVGVLPKSIQCNEREGGIGR